MRFRKSDVNKNNTWQIGTGDGTRMYHDIFLRFGVAFVSPGDPGKEGEPGTKLFYTTNPDINNWGAELKTVKKDEWIIARKGKQEVIAIGKVLEEYNYSDLFSDVDGWDSQHYIKVKWYKPKTKTRTIEFSGKPLSQSTLQGCNNPVVFNEIYKHEFEEIENEFNIEDLCLPKKINPSDIFDELIDHGVRIQDAENIKNTIYRVIRLAEWYIKNDYHTLESEIISFLINPLLIALGWSEQKVKLEYNKIDIALFKNSFIGNYSQGPDIIVEAKTFDNGLAFTNDQILKYAKNFPECKCFLATNGYRYKYFEKMNGNLTQIGYFNLLKLRDRDIINDIALTSLQTIIKIANL